MKKTRLVFALTLVILLALVATLFLMQTRLVSRLNNKLADIRSMIQQREQMQSNTDKFIGELEEKERFFSQKVSRQEKEPLELIRQLTLLAQQHGLKSIEFAIQKRQKEEGDIYRLPFVMNLEGEFRQLVLFLEAISNLEMPVSVDGINIERKEEILPRQKISLQLAAYTLLSSP
ncbi:MAG: type 4a pilus biogenesis protein PilO [Candidatus Omnitrophota bacterium]